MRSGEPANSAVRVIAIGLLAMLLLMLMLTACRNDSAAANGAGADASGVYTLVGIDDKPLPCTLTHAGTPMSIQSGTFTITPAGKCVSSIDLILGTNRHITKVTRAQYARSGDELTMNWEHAGTTQGRVLGNHFIMTNEGMVFSYQK
jgi:hypothetical protein